jgi:Ni,Fe-hydrogenase III small subunit
MAVMKAQMNQSPLAEADEIEALLPWLVTGKLTRAEEARVNRYFEAHPQTAAHVALARDEQDAAIFGNEEIKGPSSSALDRLMSQVVATPQVRQFEVPSPASVWEKIASFINGFSPTTLGIAGAAAAVVLVAQAATIGVLMNGAKAPTAGYETASGPAVPAGESIQALVTLQPNVSVGTLTETLKGLKAAVIDGPKAGNVYRLKIAGAKADTQATIARLKARGDVFAFVGPASP